MNWLDWLKALWNKIRGKDKKDDGGEWREGPFTIDCNNAEAGSFEVDCKDQDMTRPDGKPERIWIALDFDIIDYKSYAMIDNRNGIRVRSKGALEIHITGYVYAPIPTGEFKLGYKIADDELAMLINGTVCKGGGGSLAGAKLKKIVISPDGGRPAGFKWRNPVFVEGTGE